jgi:hypothetical protein
VTTDETDNRYPGELGRVPNWDVPLGSAGAFPDRETRREMARARAAAARTEKKRMYAIYVVLIAVTAAFGIVAAYQWERGKDAVANAAAIAAQNDGLAARVAELESLSEGLADMVALAFEDDPQTLLTQLSDLEERKPDATDTTIFAKLWIGAKDRAAQTQPGFETASGGDPTTSDTAGLEGAKTEIAKAEPPPQDQVKDDQVKENQAKEKQAARDEAKSAPVPADRAQPTRGTADQAAPEQAGDAWTPEGRALASVDRSANLRPSDIVIRAIAERWIQIVDGSGRPTFTKLLKGGDVHALSPADGATLITGNPTGLELTVDGVTAPPFNAKGPTRREIVLDPARLLDGTAEEPGKSPTRRAVPVK